MNILRFEMNVPTEVVLQSSEGVAVEGRYGARVMFTLADGRVMYVPPIVASKIETEGIVSGQPFQLCKAAVRTGRKRSIEWLLERGASIQARDQEMEKTEPAAPETPLERDLRASVEMATAKKASPETSSVACTKVDEIPPFAPTNTGHVDGQPADSVGDNGNAPLPRQNVLVPPVTKLEQALKTAISAAHNAERFGSEIGYVVRFDADAIKSMAITVLINMSERSPR